ncbi:MAG: TSUP family transporter [Candidatus Lokiarchaeota archaeon]|nr:TSUP family transporter [Candidatus Lokiarchaeota archaeon]
MYKTIWCIIIDEFTLISIILLLLVFFTSLIAQTIGFGGAIMLISMASFIMDLQDIIVLSGFWGILYDVFKGYNYKDYIDWGYVKRVVLGGIPGAIFGALLIEILPITILQILFGLFLFLYSAFKLVDLYRLEKESEPINEDFSKGYLTFGGFTFGFFGGLLGASGPINVILLERTNHYRESFIANFALSALPLTIMRVTVYVSSGLFPIDYFFVFLCGFPLIFITAKIGPKLTNKIPILIFKRIITIFLLIISIRTIFVSITSF